MRKKYRVILNWQGELHEFFTYGVDEGTALGQACFRLATKLDRTPYSLRQYFFDKQSAVKIEEIKL